MSDQIRVINHVVGIAIGETFRGGSAGAPLSETVHWNGNGTKSYYTLWYPMTGPWCAVFVSWVAHQAGAASVIPKHMATWLGKAEWERMGRWGWGLNGIRRGDVVYMKINAGGNSVDHVGYVESVNPDGSVNTIEGNTSLISDGRTGGCVARKQRGGQQVVGYGRPNYDSLAVVLGNSDTVIPVNYPSGGRGFLAVDGYWGPNTTRALQKRFGTPIDGVISGQIKGAHNVGVRSAQWGTGGSRLVIAMQKWLGITADGNIGPQTVRSLQTRMGTSVDGVVSAPSLMVGAMQRRLNAGTL